MSQAVLQSGKHLELKLCIAWFHVVLLYQGIHVFCQHVASWVCILVDGEVD